MKRVVDVLYGLKGYPNAARFTEFKTDLFANGSTPGITIDTAGTRALYITAVQSTAAIDFGPACVTTGSLIDYTGIVGKTSGYLFNGSMTTSTLTASTLVDDFACSCASDGLAADVLRILRRTWTGTMPNGTAAVDFKMVELVWTSTFGTAATKGGTPMMLSLDCDATINDSSANFYAVNVDLAGMTLTSCANIHGVQITTMTGVDAGINHTGNATSAYQITSGTITNAFNILAAANITNLFKFNAAAGCILAVDVNPKDTPSGGGLGADGCIRIDIGGADYFIPIFAIELS